MRSSKALVLIAISLIGLLSFTSQADATNGRFDTNAHSGNDTTHPWSTNGCTAVPDHLAGVFYFNHPCDHHDGCYGGHWESRLGCDNRFRTNMNSACNYNWAWYNPARAACYGVKETYYAGVRNLGYVAYNGWSISGPSGW